MSFAELAAARYSVRNFLDRPVEQEKVDLILEAARRAPTAANRHPQRILVLSGNEQLAKMDCCTSCRFGAPLAFLICFDRRYTWVRSYDQQHSGWVDASIVTTHMMLQAADLGLGSTWVMWFDPAETRSRFKLPDELVPVAFLPAGYPGPEALPSDQHADRLPLNEMVVESSPKLG
jgi:nitroreductase